RLLGRHPQETEIEQLVQRAEEGERGAGPDRGPNAAHAARERRHLPEPRSRGRGARADERRNAVCPKAGEDRRVSSLPAARFPAVDSRALPDRLVWSLVAVAVGVQIGYPLVPDTWRTPTTVASVVAFAAASLAGVARRHNLRGVLTVLG